MHRKLHICSVVSLCTASSGNNLEVLKGSCLDAQYIQLTMYWCMSLLRDMNTVH